MKDKVNSNFTFIVKKTIELNEQEVNEINNLFNAVFNSNSIKLRTEQEFKKKFLNNFLKFSFHGLMKLDNKIVGCYHVIPYEFNFFSSKKLFAQSVDTTISPKFRGNIYNLKKLANLVYEEIKKFNIFFVYGIANEKFYPVKKKILGWKDIGKLNYYIYPINIKKFIKKFYIPSFLVHLLINIFLKFKINYSYKYKFSISKINNEEFKLGRYDEEHKFLSIEKFQLIYKTVINKKYQNAKIIYLIDVFPLTKKNIEAAVNELSKINLDTDLIIYIGELQKVPKNLIKIPDFLLKNQRNISGKILNPTQLDEKIYNISNWNINLSNFDIK
jgi:hypothetical protein